MESPHSESLETSLEKLVHLDEAHIELGKQMFAAFGGALYGMDLLAAGALNRSKAHIAGFRQMVGAKNLICAGALLRLQLDTALRFHAAFLVEQPHDFALAVLGGKQVRDLKDRDGERMTDAYLVKKLGQEFDWVPRVYERTSGYVHFSATHLMSAMRPTVGTSESDRSITIKIGAEDKPFPSWIYIEAVDAFRAATDILLRYVHGWVFTKANPELVQKWKQDRDAKQGDA
ncbi:MAG: hypothetical protein EHM18_12980 [Acidobacteria bacterium]|nr:MAG: hypothetical protein EHM18_12980 [Acidobacteriota bacterium]